VSWKRHIAFVGISLIGGSVAGFIAAILCTPLLWRLEPVLGIELAGHSGPSDWVIYVFCGFFAVLIQMLLIYFHRRSAASRTKG
jgi:hypothetical protein